MIEYVFSPIGCPRAGFYADFGHRMTDNLRNYINEIYRITNTDEFVIKIDSSKMWNNYQEINKPIIDYYNELFQIDINFKLNLPLCGLMKDNWTDISIENFTDLNNLLKKYFKMSDKQEILYNDITQKYNFDPDNTIGVLYRGTDKYLEREPVGINLFIDKTKEILSYNSSLRIMIQTDQKQIKDMFMDIFPNNCFFIEELSHVSNNVVPHKHIDINKYHLAKHIEISVRMLSQCKFLICNYSNVTTFVGAYRNNTTNVFQF